MEDQLASSSCLVGSLDRFLNIADNQNDPVTVTSHHATPALTPSLTHSPSPERRVTLKRRTNSAKLRLSQINHEKVGLIEQRVHHRDESIKKIQQTCREFLRRQQTRREVVARSKNIVHYQVLTHLRSLQHVKKRKSVRVLQSWWRQRLAKYQADLNFMFTQQGRWTLRQYHLVRALLKGYKVRSVLSKAKKEPIKSAVLFLINANEVLEGICDDINTDTLVLDNISLSNRSCIMSRSLLIFCSKHRLDSPSFNPCQSNSKADSTLISTFSLYRRILAQFPVDWAFVDNFVREILHYRRVVSNYFTHGNQVTAKKSVVKKTIVRPPLVRSLAQKENRKDAIRNVNVLTKERNDHIDCIRHDSSSPVKLHGIHSRSTGSPVDINQQQDSMIRNDIGDGGRRDFPTPPRVPKSLLTIMRETTPQDSAISEKELPEEEYLLSATIGNIAISPLQSSPISLMPTPDMSYHSPKRSSRVIPAGICSSPSNPLPTSNTGRVNNSIMSSATTTPPRNYSAKSSVPMCKPQYSSKPHLQIDVMCAKCLGTVSAARRKRNQATRKPGLKITVSMPVSVQEPEGDYDTTHNGGMKVIHTTSYVSPHDVSPTDPVWNYTVHCPLRVPPSLDCADFDEVVSLYWSLGTVKIEIVDSERFNEDINLGDVTLFLSNFLLQRGYEQMPTSSGKVREISGSFPILNNSTSVGTSISTSVLRSKHGAHDSGSKLNAAVYLHLPNSSGGNTGVSGTPTRKSSSQSPSKSPAHPTRRPTHPAVRKSFPYQSVNSNSISSSSNENLPPSKDLKSALAHIPSPCSGGLTASARRNRRLSASACTLEATKETAVASSVTTNTQPKHETSLISCVLQEKLPPPVVNTPSSIKSPSTDPRDSRRRRQSLENVGTILDFLQDALQEEAEATVESLKQNYASCKKQEAIASANSAPFHSTPHSPASSTSLSSKSSPAESSPSINSTSDKSTSAPIPIPYTSPGSAGDVDMATVQNDLDDIMGALQRRMLAKARPL